MQTFINWRARACSGVMLAMVLVLFVGQPAPADANTTLCTKITSLPTVINRSGVYCLTRDLPYRATSGTAIEIRRNNVVLDLNGFRIFGTPALGNETTGVKISNRQKVRITNGTIERFRVGIEMDRGIANALDNLHLDQNRQFGVLLTGNGKSFKMTDNTISRTGGSSSPGLFGLVAPVSTAVYLGANAAVLPFGLRVERNTVFDVRTVTGSNASYGIYLLSTNGLVKENQVSGRELNIAVSVIGSNNIVDSNYMANETFVGNGVVTAGLGNLYTNNSVVNFSTPFFAFKDGGGNASSPN